MRSSTVFSLLFSAAAAVAQETGNAKLVTDNPPNTKYVTTFNHSGSGNITGTVNAATDATGKGVSFHIALSGFSADAEPLQYHVHVNPVPADGNCTATGAHLDPYNRGVVTACDATKPESCQVGDLSGKYGNITGPSGEKSFVDNYVSLNPSTVAFIGNRSIVFHDHAGARIACANLTLVSPAKDTPMKSMPPME